MNDTLDPAVVDGVAYVGALKHCASIKADRKGATAKAVTVAAVTVYRSLGSLPPTVSCDRPFLSILVELGEEDAQEIHIKSVEFVTKHETEACLDDSRGDD